MNPNLRFLIDVNIGITVERYLKNSGFDIVCVRDINPRLTDKEILNLAIQENRIVITLDKDFGELVYNSGLLHTGVLLLRLDDETIDKKIEILKIILDRYSNELQGAFCVYQDGKIRIKK